MGKITMNTELYQNKKVTTSGNSNSNTDGMNIGKSNTIQHPFFIVASSLLALLVWVTVAGKIGGQHVTSSAYEIVQGTGALGDYQVDTASSASGIDIFGKKSAENKEGIRFCLKRENCGYTYEDFKERCARNDDCTCCISKYGTCGCPSCSAVKCRDCGKYIGSCATDPSKCFYPTCSEIWSWDYAPSIGRKCEMEGCP